MFADPNAGKAQALRRNGKGHQIVWVFNALIIGNAIAGFHDEDPPPILDLQQA